MVDGPEARYRAVRALTEELRRPLSAEDCQIQTMPDVSPTKWHLAHTTWFFETFVLLPLQPGYRPHHPSYARLYNSYYQAVGPQHPRPRRGLVSRPSLDEVHAYRRRIDEQVLALLARGEAQGEVAARIELGLHHEQQHQELILTDIKHVLAEQPGSPAYLPAVNGGGATARPLAWVSHPGGTVEIGHAGQGFAFDNEGPRHAVLLRPFRLATRAVTCGEYLRFIEDGGYRRPEHWLSDGWAAVEREGWEAPLYWEERGGGFWVHTLTGRWPIDPAGPVCHVSYYEAEAYARWAGARLPLEAEWEAVASAAGAGAGTLLEDRRLHPAPAAGEGLAQLVGDVWEWTGSAYAPYPGYRPAAGALGEYNGKFMCSQMVLRGGSCLTPRSHVRLTYRNFFPPGARWQMTGIRLAVDA